MARTDIIEKVKFWEEQDKINNLLIPRVMEQHELMTKISKSHLENEKTLQEILLRLKKIEMQLPNFVTIGQIKSLESTIAQLESETKKMASKMDLARAVQSLKAMKGELDQLGGSINELESNMRNVARREEMNGLSKDVSTLQAVIDSKSSTEEVRKLGAKIGRIEKELALLPEEKETVGDALKTMVPYVSLIAACAALIVSLIG
jgi:phage shock protein A